MTARTAAVVVAACALVALAGCATGSLANSDTSAAASSAAASSAAPASSVTITGSTLVVTVPDLPAAASAAPPAARTTAASSTSAAQHAGSTPTAEPPSAPAPPAGPKTAATATAAPVTTSPPADTVEVATAGTASAPPGDGLNVSLANCDGCTVLATHRGVTGELSAALVGTPAGRPLLLAVAGDGQVRGVIGIPYGSAFTAPAGGVLACEKGRCIVAGRQSDGRAVLSAFELTSSGAWRDVSGDDAFPSATQQAAVVDIDGQLAIAVQDQGAAAAVWMLYTWDGERFAVAGCAADGPVPASLADVSESTCLS